MNLRFALGAHYRRHPAQLAALLLILVLALALWNGVWTLTDQARQSMSVAESQLQGYPEVRRADGLATTRSDFVRLRGEGLCVFPWLEVYRPAPEGRVIGIDVLAMHCLGDSSEAPEARLQSPMFRDMAEAVDLAAAQNVEAQLRLRASADLPLEALPAEYQLQTSSGALQAGSLADSFLLNLDALSVLIFLITVLLIRSVYSLGLNQRRAGFAVLRRHGVSPRRIRRLLVAELALLGALALVPGFWLGQAMAEAAGVAVDQALGSLFDVSVYAGPSSPAGLLLPVGGLVLALMACALEIQPAKGRWWLGPAAWMAGVLVLVTGVIWVVLADSVLAVFVALGLSLIAAGVLTPPLLRRLYQFGADRSKSPLRLWQWREREVMARSLGLPMVAMQLALASVLAIHALVVTFEATFQEWLEQRLQGDLYVTLPQQSSIADTENALQSVNGLEGWHFLEQGSARLEQGATGLEEGTSSLMQSPESTSVDVKWVDPGSPLIQGWPLLTSLAEPWQALDRPEHVMVNEQLALRHGYEPGDTIRLALESGSRTLTVAGVYPDYGRPVGEVLLARSGQGEAVGIDSTSLALRQGSAGRDEIASALAAVWGEPVDLQDNRTILQLANGIFDQTFALTRAISLFALALAAVSLLLFAWVFFRTRLPAYRLLAVWGMGRRQIHLRLTWLAVSGQLVLFVLSLPVGLWLTWVLVARINPLSFGWSLPFDWYPDFWALLGLLCAGIGLLVALLMRRVLP